MHIAYDHHPLLKPSARPEMPLLGAASFLSKDVFGSVLCQQREQLFRVHSCFHPVQHWALLHQSGLTSWSRISAPALLPPLLSRKASKCCQRDLLPEKFPWLLMGPGACPKPTQCAEVQGATQNSSWPRGSSEHPSILLQG